MTDARQYAVWHNPRSRSIISRPFSREPIHIILKPRLHDTSCCLTGCQSGLTTGCIVYTNIQPVLKGLTNGCIVYTVGCQTDCTTRFDNQLNEQWLFVQHSWTNSGCSFSTVVKPVDNQFDNRLDVCLHDTAGCQSGCTTGLTTGCIV